MSSNSFPPTSRYNGLDTATVQTADGTTISYLTRRFVPSPAEFADFQEYTVSQGDRLDNITAKYLGDPEQFWRICDANGAIRPEELTDTIGAKIRITLPQGIPGPTNA